MFCLPWCPESVCLILPPKKGKILQLASVSPLTQAQAHQGRAPTGAKRKGHAAPTNIIQALFFLLLGNPT
ncbi:hypothetical protein Y1Q_0000229 [Alligator mississippiensis]|uniref:Uncharacterized protein n=1 Tax=Alligator mississippiensis TaxID=8496 RepID=A0A151P064_ALLMI|nr:hypothetical protein Y1Q_0000229 [Alligator mississippiensis]